MQTAHKRPIANPSDAAVRELRRESINPSGGQVKQPFISGDATVPSYLGGFLQISSVVQSAFVLGFDHQTLSRSKFPMIKI